jgi:hypothetical protein
LKFDLFKAGDNDYLLKLECDCVISFFSQGVVEGVKKRGKKKVGQNINRLDLLFENGL